MGELCNNSEDITLEGEFSQTEGISIDVGFGMDFALSASEEVHASCGLATASETVSASWGAEMSTSSTWEKSQTMTITIPVPPGKCVVIRQMQGQYGTPSLSPYKIYAHYYNVYEHDAK